MFFVACGDKIISTQNQPTEQYKIEKTPDATAVTTEGVGNIYGSGNPYFFHSIDSIMQNVYVQNAMTEVSNAGYSYAEEFSLIVESESPLSIEQCEFAVIAMIPNDGTDNRVVYIGVPLSWNIENVDAIILSFGDQPYDQSGDFEPLVDNVWIGDFESAGGASPKVGKTAWSWGRWSKCTLSHTVAGAVGSAVGCAFSGPGYAGCLGVGVLASAAGSMAGCAVAEALR